MMMVMNLVFLVTALQLAEATFCAPYQLDQVCSNTPLAVKQSGEPIDEGCTLLPRENEIQSFHMDVGSQVDFRNKPCEYTFELCGYAVLTPLTLSYYAFQGTGSDSDVTYHRMSDSIEGSYTQPRRTHVFTQQGYPIRVYEADTGALVGELDTSGVECGAEILISESKLQSTSGVPASATTNSGTGESCPYQICAKTPMHKRVSILGTTVSSEREADVNSGECMNRTRPAKEQFFFRVMDGTLVEYPADPDCIVQHIEICAFYVKNAGANLRTFQGTSLDGLATHEISRSVSSDQWQLVATDKGSPIVVRDQDGRILGEIPTEGKRCGEDHFEASESTIVPVESEAPSLKGCFLVDFEMASEQPLVPGEVLTFDIVSFAQKISVRCNVCGDVDEVEFIWDGNSHIDRTPAYWMSGSTEGDDEVRQITSIMDCTKETEIEVVGRRNGGDAFTENFTIKANCVMA